MLETTGFTGVQAFFDFTTSRQKINKISKYIVLDRLKSDEIAKVMGKVMGRKIAP